MSEAKKVEEVNESDNLTEQQRYIRSQIVDLKNKQARIHFELDQVNASLGVFENAYQKTFEEQKTEEK